MTTQLCPADPGASWSKEDLQRIYMDFLVDEGYRPQIDDEGDVLFKCEGLSYYIKVMPDDLQYFQLVLPNIHTISDSDRQGALGAIVSAATETKAVKVVLVRDQICIAIEGFIPRPDDCKPMIRRGIVCLQRARTIFSSEIIKLERLEAAECNGVVNIC